VRSGECPALRRDNTMSNSITTEEIAFALDQYRRALEMAGLELVGTIDLEALYGSGLYVVRTHFDGSKIHDLPGFNGRPGSGFTSKRAAVEALWLATFVVRDMTKDLEDLAAILGM